MSGQKCINLQIRKLLLGIIYRIQQRELNSTELSLLEFFFFFIVLDI